MRWKVWLGVPLLGLGGLLAFTPFELRTRSEPQLLFGRFALLGIAMIVAGAGLLVADLRDRLRKEPPSR